MPTGVKSYFFEELFVTILRDMFSYFYLPSTNYDFRSCIKAIDYFIRNYKEVFRSELRQITLQKNRAKGKLA